ncbi:cyclic nucleotide-binding-like protein [Pavlovales sp. CCMP2436]|nr:cyclic nucleotide-binding-like protein [Pavlovales sp. CCMP2436]
MPGSVAELSGQLAGSAMMQDEPGDLPLAYKTLPMRMKRRPSVSAEVPVPFGKYVPAKKFFKSDEQVEAIRAALKGNFLFQGLSFKQLIDVIDSFFEKTVVNGEEVMTQGADADNFYVISSGKFDAVKDGAVVFSYDGSGAFGELALLYSCPRAASVFARTDGRLWGLDRVTFSRMLIADRQDRAVVTSAWLTRMPLLSYLSKDEIGKLTDALSSHDYKAGDTIFSQGDKGTAFYLVDEGQATGVYIAADGTAKDVCNLVQGDYFGERALLTDEPRALTVRAAVDLKLLALDADTFERILGPCKGAMAKRIASYERLGDAEEAE